MEAVDVRMATHREIFSHDILLVACHIKDILSKIKIKFGRSLERDIAVSKVADFVDKR